MPNRKELRKQKQTATSQISNIDRLLDQLQKLIQKKNYRQAIEKVKNISKMHPDVKISPSEAEIWAWQGQQEYSQSQYRQALVSLRHAVGLGCGAESHYWLAKTLLTLGDLDEALVTMRSAFEDKVLTTDFAGSYLKLLLMKGATSEVVELLKTQCDRFSATQLHWVKGFLSLQAENLTAALNHFQKMDSPATPGDFPAAWIAYTQQQLGHWELAESALGLSKKDKLSTPLSTHPVIEQLGLVQAVSRAGSSAAVIPIDPQQGKQRTLSLILRLIQLLDESNYHQAAHTLQKLPHPCLDFPEVDALHRQVMILAADHALQTDAVDCLVAFLEATVYQPPFDVQVVLKLRCVYEGADCSIQEVKRLLNHLMAEVKKLAQTHPQNWPESQLNSTLAHIHCWLSDAWVDRGYQQQGYKELQIAERLCPNSPEVIGRHGLRAYLQDNSTKATLLLTQALEGGCSTSEVYLALLSELKDQGDLDTIKDIRRRFGKLFDDEEIDTVEIPRWVEALFSQDYQSFTKLIATKNNQDAALQASQIFVATVKGELTTAGRVDFDLAQATNQWTQLLQKVAVPEQIPVIQAIFLAVQLFAKRQKGIAALQTEYLQRLLKIAPEYPEAQLAYFVLWAVKGDRPQPMQAEIRNYLSKSPQPSTALAQIQFQVRRFAQTEALRSLIDEFLRQDAQNPQLLLAKATTYPIDSKNYTELKEQGFELARRLQDTASLQAYREEKTIYAKIESQKMTSTFLPDFLAGDPLERINVAQKMLHSMFGDDIPPEAMAKMLPELMRILSEDLMDDDEDYYEDDNDDDYDFKPRPLFGGIPVPPSAKRPTTKKRRK